MPLRAAVVGAAVTLGRERTGRPGAARSRARRDEDAITLAVEAAGRALPRDLARVGAVIFCSTTPPYRDGGSVQLLTELLGLQGDVVALELTASTRDALTAVRVAAALTATDRPVLVCAANYAPGNPVTGDGAVAIVVEGVPAGTAVPPRTMAVLTPAASSAVELRDRWRLPDEQDHHVADSSFVESIGTRHLATELLARVPRALIAPPVVVGPSRRASRLLERELGGPSDTVTDHVGDLGAAHPLLRLLSSLEAPRLVVGLSNGLGEAVRVDPTPTGDQWSTRLRDELADTGALTPPEPPAGDMPGFAPYASGPRAWRERDRDLRLIGIVDPAGNDDLVPARHAPTGVVLSWTQDHVYPVPEPVEMVAVSLDAGGQFFGQVADGEHVTMGERVELVPRRLHRGNGLIQYFWKARPCR
jgi:hypothetical protein